MLLGPGQNTILALNVCILANTNGSLIQICHVQNWMCLYKHSTCKVALGTGVPPNENSYLPVAV